MDEPLMGVIAIFGCNFAPRGWAFCSGQIVPIAQNTALFSLLGTTYGGNGTSTFAYPDLRGRVPIGQGQGPGLSPYVLGEQSGIENVTILSAEMPAHNHGLRVANTSSNLTAPAANASIANYADLNGDGGQTYSAVAPNINLHATTVGIAGGNQPHSNIQPYLAINYCIAIQGVFPARN